MVAMEPAAPDQQATGALWRQELRAVVVLAVPIVVQSASQQAMTVTDQIFLGHLGTAELGAAALANAYVNLMWFFLLGFASALDTLGSNAYGAGDRRALVMWCATAFSSVTLLVVPIAVGMAMAPHAAVHVFKQDATTARLMGEFCAGLIPGMWPMMWAIVLTKYLQTQNVMMVPSVVAFATFLLNIAFNGLLVHTIGFQGSALATTLSRTSQFFMMVGAVWCHERRRRRQPQAAWGVLLAEQGSQGQGQEDEDAQDPKACMLQGGPPSRAGGQGWEEGDVEADGAAADASGARLGAGTLATATMGGAAGGGAASGLDFEDVPLLMAGEEMLGAAAAATAAAAQQQGQAESGGRSMQALTPASGASRAPRARMQLLPALEGACDARDSVREQRRSWCGAAGPAAAAADPQLLMTPPPQVTATPSGGAGGSGSMQPLRSLLHDGARLCCASLHPRVLFRFLRLGVPGGLSMSFEAGAFDIVTVFASRLGTTITAAHSAMLSVCTLTYLACPFAFATAGAIRVGNLLGAGRPAPAKRAAVVCVAIGGCFMALMAVLILACRNVLGYMYSSDEEVVGIMASLSIWAAMFQVSDGLMGTSQGVLRGCGHQHQTMVFNFAGFWVGGVVVGYLLCFHAGRGIQGLWMGIASGDTLTAILNLTALKLIDWPREARKAVARLQALAEEQADSDEAAGASGERKALLGGGGGGSAAASSDVVGGGRSYAGGLRRMWSERVRAAAVVRARPGLSDSLASLGSLVSPREWMRSFSGALGHRKAASVSAGLGLGSSGAGGLHDTVGGEAQLAPVRGGAEA